MRDNALRRAVMLLTVGTLVLGQVGTGCSASPTLAPATVESATAAYVYLDADRSVADELVVELTQLDASRGGALLTGIDHFSVRQDAAGVWGVRVAFHLDTLRVERDELQQRASGLSAELTWLRNGDLWPDCGADSDCWQPRVGES